VPRHLCEWQEVGRPASGVSRRCGRQRVRQAVEQRDGGASIGRWCEYRTMVRCLREWREARCPASDESRHTGGSTRQAAKLRDAATAARRQGCSRAGHRQLLRYTLEQCQAPAYFPLRHFPPSAAKQAIMVCIVHCLLPSILTSCSMFLEECFHYV
jgi:hypothetical protein